MFDCFNVEPDSDMMVRERGRERRVLAALVFSSPFLEIPHTYSPLENTELLREKEEECESLEGNKRTSYDLNAYKS